MEQERLLGLVERASQGNTEAFEELCRYKARDVLYICIHLMGNLQDGEDAAQEVFLAMQTSILRLRNPHAFPAWLNRLITNTCKQLLRQSRRRVTLQVESFADELQELACEFLPQDFAEEKEKQQLVRQALQSLPFQYRTVLILFYYNNSSAKDIAQALDINLKSAQNLLVRARKALRREIEHATGKALAPPESATRLGGVLVLTRILQSDAAQSITEQSLCRVVVVATAGVATAGAVAATGSTTAATVAAAGKLAGWVGAGLTAVASTTAAVVITAASSASPASPAQSLPVDPQPSGSTSLAGEAWNVDDSPLEAWFAYSEVESTSRAQSPVATAPQEPPQEAPAPEQPAPAPRTTTYTGRFVFVTAEGTPLPGHGRLAEGFVVQAHSGEMLLATAVADENGGYSLPLAEEQNAFAVTVLPLYGFGLAGQPGLEIEAAPGETQLPEIAFTDTMPPTATTSFIGPDGEPMEGAVNPAAALVTAYDATEVQIAWRVENDAGEALLAGRGETADFAGLARGTAPQEYTLVYTLTDAAGNTATAVREFLLFEKG